MDSTGLQPVDLLRVNVMARVSANDGVEVEVEEVEVEEVEVEEVEVGVQ